MICDDALYKLMFYLLTYISNILHSVLACDGPAAKQTPHSQLMYALPSYAVVEHYVSQYVDIQHL